jgi:hypothetical protein
MTGLLTGTAYAGEAHRVDRNDIARNQVEAVLVVISELLQHEDTGDVITSVHD